MSRELDVLIEKARRVRMTEKDVQAQRRSFAFGNAGFENPDITWEMIKAADEERETKVA